MLVRIEKTRNGFVDERSWHVFVEAESYVWVVDASFVFDHCWCHLSSPRSPSAMTAFFCASGDQDVDFPLSKSSCFSWRALVDRIARDECGGKNAFQDEVE